MTFDPKWLAQLLKSIEETSREQARVVGPLVEHINRDAEARARALAPVIAEIHRQSEAQARELAPVIAAINKASNDAAAAVEPALRVLTGFQGATPTRTSFIPPPRDWESPASAAVEKIKSAAGGAEPAKAELAFELARGVSDATGRLIASNTENRTALVVAIGRLVAASDNNTKKMSLLTALYVVLTAIMLVVGITNVYLVWHAPAPRIDVHVPPPVINVQPVIAAPTTTTPAAPPAPRRVP